MTIEGLNSPKYWRQKIKYFFERERKRINWHIKRAKKLGKGEEVKYWFGVLYFLDCDERRIFP